MTQDNITTFNAYCTTFDHFTCSSIPLHIGQTTTDFLHIVYIPYLSVDCTTSFFNQRYPVIWKNSKSIRFLFD